MQVKVSKPEQVQGIYELIKSELEDGVQFPEGTILTVTAPKNQAGRLCADGCGQTTSGGLWMPGHDAKYKSRLYSAFRSGDPEQVAIAKAELKRLNWDEPKQGKGQTFEPLPVPTADANVTEPKPEAKPKVGDSKSTSK